MSFGSKFFKFNYQKNSEDPEKYSGFIYANPENIEFTYTIKDNKLVEYTPTNFTEDFFYSLHDLIKLEEKVND